MDRSRLGIKEQKVILYVGRLEKTKGPATLLHAFARMTNAAGNGSGVGSPEGPPPWRASNPGPMRTTCDPYVKI
ncbi:hypothetical protein SY88_12935 [Clostridiales bacterium PH28_bin88]|nr:hypothetical protein SY88_12935 [Clostridiales bacterium PH28_bin88]